MFSNPVVEALPEDSGRVLVGVLDEFALATQFNKAVDAITDAEGPWRRGTAHALSLSINVSL